MGYDMYMRARQGGAAIPDLAERDDESRIVGYFRRQWVKLNGAD